VILSHKYVQPAGSGVLAMQSEIARDVAERLQLKLTGEDHRQLASVATANSEAYQHFLKGLFYVRQGTQASLHKGIETFQKAITLDPSYAQAYASIAQAYLELGLFYEAPRDAMPKARQFASQAIQADPTLPDANIALGVISLVYDWDWDAAIKVMTASAAWSTGALEMFSCSAHLLASTGRGPEAEHELKRALLVDPLSPMLRNELGCGAYYRRRYDDAVTENRLALNYDPNNLTAYWGLGRAFGQQQRYREALDELNMVEKRIGVTPSLILAEIGYVMAASGRVADARAMLKKLNLLSATEFVDPYLIATIHMALGDTPKALTSLEHAYTARSGFMVSLKSEPKWDGIRSTPEFLDLLKRVGF
jgi:tetratricopeptide (TPR) repeat protein